VHYKILKANADPAEKFRPEIPAAEINRFLPQSSQHHPRTLARLSYDQKRLHGQFVVEDRFVRCIRAGYGSEVWKDSCVEFFVEPKACHGYFNFEFNCGGAFLVNHIVDPTRAADGFKEFTRLSESEAKQVRVQASLPSVVEPEVAWPITWTLEFSIPFSLFEPYVGSVGAVAGQTWRGNFFKCAEENSHPHWAAWSPVDEFNFHLPRCFGELYFAGE